MKHLKQYRIQFSGLTLGSHDFEFEIGDSFFDRFPYSIVKKGAINVTVNLNKQANFMVMMVYIDGHIQLDCDLCLTSFPAPCSAQERLIIKFNDEEIEELTDEIIVLGKNEFELDLSDYLYECINLTVPAYIRCEELGDGLQCDEEMVKTIQNLAPTEPEEAKTDPRWEALKGIKNN